MNSGSTFNFTDAMCIILIQIIDRKVGKGGGMVLKHDKSIYKI